MFWQSSHLEYLGCRRHTGLTFKARATCGSFGVAISLYDSAMFCYTQKLYCHAWAFFSRWSPAIKSTHAHLPGLMWTAWYRCASVILYLAQPTRSGDRSGASEWGVVGLRDQVVTCIVLLQTLLWRNSWNDVHISLISCLYLLSKPNYMQIMEG